MTHDLKKYKEALILLPQINAILRVFNLTEKTLVFYSHFIPVARVLLVVKEQKAILQTHKEMYSKIKDQKGLKKNNY